LFRSYKRNEHRISAFRGVAIRHQWVDVLRRRQPTANMTTNVEKKTIGCDRCVRRRMPVEREFEMKVEILKTNYFGLFSGLKMRLLLLLG